MLKRFTPARVELGRAGDGLPTRELLDFQLAHARARDAVYAQMDTHSLTSALLQRGLAFQQVQSAAATRAVYLKRPDLGRKLQEQAALTKGDFDVAFVIADGLSALAVDRHAIPLLDAVLPLLGGLRVAPVIVAEQARVALSDDIGERLGAKLVAMLIGERPGMSAPDSLGVYLTYDPRPGRNDAERNCISNIRTEGLSYREGAHRIAFLIREALSRKLTGVSLRFSTEPALPEDASSSGGGSTATDQDTRG